MKQGVLIWVLLLSCYLGSSGITYAQENPAKPDTVQPRQIITPIPVAGAANRDKDQEKNPTGLSKAKTATLLSAAVPGLGQIYNGRYWKVPIIYAIGGGLVYLAYTNNQEYQCFNAAADSLASAPSITSLFVCGRRYSAQGIRNNRNFYRRNRDLSIIFIGITYVLNIVDANVDAHMKGFDVSEDLSMNITPAAVPSINGLTAGVNITFNFRK